MGRPPIKRRGPKRDTTLPSKLNKQARSKLQQRNHRVKKKLAIKKVTKECFVSLENIKIPIHLMCRRLDTHLLKKVIKLESLVV